jgi:hypothetical protein
MKTKGDIINLSFIKIPRIETEQPVLTLSRALWCMDEYADEVLKNAKVEIRQMTNAEIIQAIDKCKHLNRTWNEDIGRFTCDDCNIIC